MSLAVSHVCAMPCLACLLYVLCYICLGTYELAPPPPELRFEIILSPTAARDLADATEREVAAVRRATAAEEEARAAKKALEEMKAVGKIHLSRNLWSFCPVLSRYSRLSCGLGLLVLCCLVRVLRLLLSFTPPLPFITVAGGEDAAGLAAARKEASSAFLESYKQNEEAYASTRATTLSSEVAAAVGMLQTRMGEILAKTAAADAQHRADQVCASTNVVFDVPLPATPTAVCLSETFPADFLT